VIPSWYAKVSDAGFLVDHSWDPCKHYGEKIIKIAFEETILF
jgi:hypothetical protein